jgi:hypothetical protein
VRNLFLFFVAVDLIAHGYVVAGCLVMWCAFSMKGRA